MGKALPKSVYLPLGGGLGDVVCNYFRGENGWKWLEPVKKRHPNLRVKVLSATHSPQSLKLIKHNPYIDHMQEFGWTLNGGKVWEQHAGMAVRLQQAKELIKNLKPEMPKLYLSEDDHKAVNEIKNAGDFVFIHPFAGLKDREVLPAQEYIPLIDALIDKHGLNVVTVGATHQRRNMKSSWDMEEEFTYERSGLFNLVNKTNARVAIGLSRAAHSFIGNWSVFSCAFWLIEGRSTVLTDQKKLKMIEKRFKKGQRWHKHGDCRLVCVEDERYNKVRAEVLQRYGA